MFFFYVTTNNKFEDRARPRVHEKLLAGHNLKTGCGFFKAFGFLSFEPQVRRLRTVCSEQTDDSPGTQHIDCCADGPHRSTKIKLDFEICCFLFWLLLLTVFRLLLLARL